MIVKRPNPCFWIEAESYISADIKILVGFQWSIDTTMRFINEWSHCWVTQLCGAFRSEVTPKDNVMSYVLLYRPYVWRKTFFLFAVISNSVIDRALECHKRSKSIHRTALNFYEFLYFRGWMRNSKGLIQTLNIKTHAFNCILQNIQLYSV